MIRSQAGTTIRCHFAGYSNTPNLIPNALNIIAPRIWVASPSSTGAWTGTCSGGVISMFFNNGWDFRLPLNEAYEPVSDFFFVLAHEILHGLGLNHSTDPTTLMAGNPGRSLAKDDVDALRSAYSVTSGPLYIGASTNPYATSWSGLTAPSGSTNAPPSIAGDVDNQTSLFLVAVKGAGDQVVYTSIGNAHGGAWGGWINHGETTQAGIGVARKKNPGAWRIVWPENTVDRRIRMRGSTNGTTWGSAFYPFPCTQPIPPAVAEHPTHGCTNFRVAIAYAGDVGRWVMVWTTRDQSRLRASSSTDGTTWATPVELRDGIGSAFLYSSRGPGLACADNVSGDYDCEVTYVNDGEVPRLYATRLNVSAAGGVSATTTNNVIVSAGVPATYPTEAALGPTLDASLLYDRAQGLFGYAYNEWEDPVPGTSRVIVGFKHGTTCGTIESGETCAFPCYFCPVLWSSCERRGSEFGVGATYSQWWGERVVIGAGSAGTCP